MFKTKAGTAEMMETEQRAMGSHREPTSPPPPAPPAEKKPEARRDGMTLRKAAELFSFDARGVTLEGRLLRIDKVTVKGKPGVVQYTIVNANGTYKCLGTYDLDSKIRTSDVGRKIEITYTGENHDVQRNGNSMKIFDVWIEDRQKVHDGPPEPNFEITDEDIPF